MQEHIRRTCPNDILKYIQEFFGPRHRDATLMERQPTDGGRLLDECTPADGYRLGSQE